MSSQYILDTGKINSSCPSFTAIDFETANEQRTSACQLGIVVVEGGQVIHHQAWLIKPPTPRFTFSYLHGITYQMVQDAPVFSELWPIIRPHIEQKIVAAHNASFDTAVLTATLKHYGLTVPKFNVVDSLHTARRAWPHLPNHKLSTVACHLNISLNHHDAASDALACAEIIRKAGWHRVTVK